jgi:hypothetical protein
MARLFIYPPVAVSVSVPPIAFTDGGVNTPVTPQAPLPTYQTASPLVHEYLDFSADNVTDSAYTEIISDSGATRARKMQVFMSSGEPLFLAFGVAASEVEQKFIVPGENLVLDFEVPPNTRLSLRAVNSGVTVNSGQIFINLFG